MKDIDMNLLTKTSQPAELNTEILQFPTPQELKVMMQRLDLVTTSMRAQINEVIEAQKRIGKSIYPLYLTPIIPPDLTKFFDVKEWVTLNEVLQIVIEYEDSQGEPVELHVSVSEDFAKNSIKDLEKNAIQIKERDIDNQKKAAKNKLKRDRALYEELKKQFEGTLS